LIVALGYEIQRIGLLQLLFHRFWILEVDDASVENKEPSLPLQSAVCD